VNQDYYAVSARRGNPYGSRPKPPAHRLVDRLESLRDDLFDIYEEDETQAVLERLINVLIDHLVGHA
jgi:hypothetical protein